MKGKWNRLAALVHSLAALYVILFLVLYYNAFARFAGVLWLNAAAHFLIWVPFGLLLPLLCTYSISLLRTVRWGLTAALVAELPNLMTQVGLHTLLLSGLAVVCAGVGVLAGFLLWKWLIHRRLKFTRTLVFDA